MKKASVDQQIANNLILAIEAYVDRQTGRKALADNLAIVVTCMQLKALLKTEPPQGQQ